MIFCMLVVAVLVLVLRPLEREASVMVWSQMRSLLTTALQLRIGRPDSSESIAFLNGIFGVRDNNAPPRIVEGRQDDTQTVSNSEVRSRNRKGCRNPE